MYFVSDLVALEDILRSQKVPSSNLPSTTALSLRKFTRQPGVQRVLDRGKNGADRRFEPRGSFHQRHLHPMKEISNTAFKNPILVLFGLVRDPLASGVSGTRQQGEAYTQPPLLTGDILRTDR
jgi:hypothetical protein